MPRTSAGPAAPRRRAGAAVPVDLAQLSRRLLDRLGEVTEVLVGAILAEDPSYTGSGRPSREDLARSCRDNLRRILEDLAGQPLPVDRFGAPRDTGHRRAEQGVPLESVLHAYRLGHRVIWEQLVALARADGSAALDVLVDAAGQVWSVVDAYSAEVARSYRATELEIARHDDRRRDALLAALLDGRGADPAVAADAAAALQLPERGRLCAAALSGTRHARAARDALSVRGLRSAWRTLADREVGVVALGGTPVADVAAQLIRVGVVRAGLSPAVVGLGELGAAARLADIALRGGAGVAELDEVLPGALLASSPDLAARLVDRALAPLLRLPAAERDLLLQTLQTWLACGGSAGRTAAGLYCHRNTVLNRLRRIEALTGRSTADVQALVDWRLGLLAREVTGAGEPTGAAGG